MAARLHTPLIAIDPGSERSGYAELTPEYALGTWRYLENAELVVLLRSTSLPVTIEHLQSYGNRMGRELLDTSFWSGRFAQAALEQGRYVYLLPRAEVRKQFANGQPFARVNDAWIRFGLQQRFGDKALEKVNAHCIQAFALGVTFLDLMPIIREQYRCLT